jgi:hypothetical protein
LYGGFLWARRALNGPFRRFFGPGRHAPGRRLHAHRTRRRRRPDAVEHRAQAVGVCRGRHLGARGPPRPFDCHSPVVRRDFWSNSERWEVL